MKIEVVIPKSGWILSKIGERTAANCKVEGVEMKTSFEPNSDVDANYYCDIQNTYFGQKTKLDIGFFTHADLNSEAWLTNLMYERNGFKNLDGIISMNSRYTEMMEKIGYPKERLITITPGQVYDTFKLKKTVIGIVSRGGYPGYGQFFMEELFLKYDLGNDFKFRFLGNGWDNILPIAKAKGIEVELIGDADYSVYPKFYHEIDYLLIPSLYTAGPISFQEALASGVSIISSDTGFANYEFKPDYIFPPGNCNWLYNILKEIRLPIINRRKQVEHMSWEKYASDVVDFIKKIK